ncbi:hypothetical protein B6U74_04440 [Candidatus Bathyarchaeota archaeon ex4484_205]|nr:MAG: hypothetical protein B6U74_04440 [Candidatus Bathyarchaeota archaeon ex4484_205]
MSSKRLLEIYAHLYKEFIYVRRYYSILIMVFIMPYIMAVISSLLGFAAYIMVGESAYEKFTSTTGEEDVFTYFLIGIGLFVPSTLIISLTSQLTASEMERGTLEYIFLSPISRILATITFPIPWMISIIAVSILSYMPFFVLKFGFPFSIEMIQGYVATLIGLTPLLGIGLLAATLTLKIKEYWVVGNLLQGIILFFSGFTYPITILPYWMQLLSMVLPTSHAVELIRDVIERHVSLIMSGRLPILLFMVPLYLLPAMVSYKYVLRRGELTGELYKY